MTTRLLGLDFADLDAAAAARLLAQRDAAAPFSYVVTPNADHLVRLHRHLDLMPVYRDASLCLLDSHVVGLVARLLALPTPTVAIGSDLTALLMRHYVQPDEPITIVGLHPKWLPPLIERFKLTRVAHCYPPFGFERDPVALQTAVDFVLRHPARFVFLAVGSPRQEILANAVHAAGGAVGTGLCIGASLEFLAGAAMRAPRWMQQTGLEWLYRLAGDPRRLARRYLYDDPPVLALLLREAVMRRREMS